MFVAVMEIMWEYISTTVLRRTVQNSACAERSMSSCLSLSTTYFADVIIIFGLIRYQHLEL